MKQVVVEFHVNARTGWATAFWFNYSFWIYCLASARSLNEVEAAHLLTEACKDGLETVFNDNLSAKEKREKLLIAGSIFWQVVAGMSDDKPTEDIALAVAV